MATLNPNQKLRIKNIETIQISAATLGSIAGVIYAGKTGGGFWRYVGYWIAGGVAVGLVSQLVATPFKNKILKEAEETTSTKFVITSQEMATPVEKNAILAAAIDLANKNKKDNWISKYKGDGLDEFARKWNSAKPTMKEYNALNSFLTKYVKNDTETLKFLTEEEKALVAGITERLMKA